MFFLHFFHPFTIQTMLGLLNRSAEPSGSKPFGCEPLDPELAAEGLRVERLKAELITPKPSPLKASAPEGNSLIPALSRILLKLNSIFPFKSRLWRDVI